MQFCPALSKIRRQLIGQNSASQKGNLTFDLHRAMEKDGNPSSWPLIIRLDSPGIRSEGPTAPTPMQTIRGTGQKWKDLQTTSLVVTPTGFFPSAFVTMDTGDNDVINPGVHVHLKRPPFENCVRLFRSKLYEITKLPETSETPELPPSKQREWKEAIAHLIGLVFLLLVSYIISLLNSTLKKNAGHQLYTCDICTYET